MDDLRPIRALPLAGQTPGAIETVRPTFRWVDPGTLLVEQTYQRDLSDKSFRLIRRIVAGWDWKAMKPPICSVGPGGALVVIDGQHTAIAAATHPDIAEIPVMVVASASVAERAGSFVKHNADRIAMTGTQVHHAALAAGDEVAVAMDQACRAAGAQILRNPPGQGVYRIGDTLAVATIRSMTAPRGVAFTTRVLRVLVGAKRAPLFSAEIQAVAALLTEPEWKGVISEDDLALVVRSRSAPDWLAHAEVHVRKGLKMPIARALAIDWFKAAPKRRRAA